MKTSEEAERFFEELLSIINWDKMSEIDFNDRRNSIMDKISEAAGGRRGGGPGNVNFYPSDYKGGCHDKAFFVSLKGKRWNIPARQRLKFDEMISEIIKHCQGSCPGYTKEVFIVCDNWDDDVMHKWQSNIDTMKRNDGTVFHVFIITGRTAATGKL
jgi:hypothetical protein